MIVTCREHFILHLLLTKMIDLEDRYKMFHTFWIMSTQRNIISKLYTYARSLQRESVSDFMRKIQKKSVSQRLGQQAVDDKHNITIQAVAHRVKSKTFKDWSLYE